MPELTFGCSVFVMADGTAAVEGDCIVWIPELTTGISVFGAVGNEARDGDGVVGMPVSR